MTLPRTYNLYHQLIVLSRHIEYQLMSQLARLPGKQYQQLKMSYAAPLMVIGKKAIRVSVLAERMGISKQLCNQSLKPIESIGLLTKISDPNDGRGKLVQVSPKGEQLLNDAFIGIAQIQANFGQALTATECSDLNQDINTLSIALGLSRGKQAIPYVSLIGNLSRYFERNLMQANIDDGFMGLQMAFSQVLNFLPTHPKGEISITELAKLNRLSVQAIARTVNDLETKDLICRIDSDSDKRQRLIRLSDRGQALIANSIRISQSFDKAIETIIGADGLSRLETSLQAICDWLNQQSEQQKLDKLACLQDYIHNSAMRRLHQNTSVDSAPLVQLLDPDKLQALDQTLDNLLEQLFENNTL